MERVLPVELEMLADLMGPGSSAAKALRIVQEAESHQVFRDGRFLLIIDLVGDTAAFGPGPFIELQRRLSSPRPPASGARHSAAASTPPTTERSPNSRLASPETAQAPPIR